LVYQLRSDELQVLVVAHHKRRPQYWTRRTG
jgi:hypothetical protein